MKKEIYNLYNLSLARNFLYGLAILWIMFFHSNITVHNSFLYWIKSHGNAGVDIFFLLSGISLYFSYTKNKSIKRFYINRAVKIIPLYIILICLPLLIKNILYGSAKGFLKDVCLYQTPWFVPAILIFYLFYPLLYYIFFVKKKNSVAGGGIILCLFAILIAAYIPCRRHYSNLDVFIDRMPIMIIGTIFGKFVYEKKSIKVWQALIIIAGFVGTLILHEFTLDHEYSYEFRCLFYIFLSLVFVALFSLLFKLNQKHLGIINSSISYLGGFTLEIYLIHERLISALYKSLSLQAKGIPSNNLWFQFFCIFFAILLAILIGTGMNQITKTIREKLKKPDSAETTKQ